MDKRKDRYVAQIEVAASPSLDDKEVYVSWCANLLVMHIQGSIRMHMPSCIQQSCINFDIAYAGFVAQMQHVQYTIYDFSQSPHL